MCCKAENRMKAAKPFWVWRLSFIDIHELKAQICLCGYLALIMEVYLLQKRNMCRRQTADNKILKLRYHDISERQFH